MKHDLSAAMLHGVLSVLPRWQCKRCEIQTNGLNRPNTLLIETNGLSRPGTPLIEPKRPEQQTDSANPPDQNCSRNDAASSWKCHASVSRKGKAARSSILCCKREVPPGILNPARSTNTSSCREMDCRQEMGLPRCQEMGLPRSLGR